MTNEQRRLAAIVSADIAGYSRLMGRDESGTLAALKAIRQEVVDPAIARHGGRIVKTTGDGLLLEFPSVVNAVRCAVEVQTAIADRNGEVPDDRRIVFRIGINLGDIIVEDDDLFGDGVNVAARLQEIAPPGGICISSRVHEDVRDRLDAAFEEGGSRTLKNIARPVQVWRWQPGTAVGSRPEPEPTALPLLDRPSIAVLPFQNMSGDPKQEYFADGIVEDIITALSNIRSLLVVARNSSFIYKGKAVDVRQVARELGVRYVLEGSVRKSGERVRITGQLIDATTGGHIWADRFDGALADIFDLQDDVTTRLVGALAPNVRDAEIDRARRKPTASLTAYDCYLRALYFMHRGSKADSDEALALIAVALEADPKFALAAGLGAMIHNRRVAYGWAKTLDAASAAAALIDVASERASDDADICMMVAHASSVFGGEPDKTELLYRRSLEMNPNSAWAWTMWSTYGARRGRQDEALAAVDRAKQLSPRGPFGFHHEWVLGVCAVRQRELDRADLHFRRSIQDVSAFRLSWAFLTATAAMRGDLKEAQWGLGEFLREQPDETVTTFAGTLRLASFEAALVEFVMDGLSRAGLSE
jgi:adenylate cyclase